MKTVANAFAALLLGVMFTVPAFAVDYTKGSVRKVDAKSRQVTIAHGELKNLNMPAMTMVFVAADEAMLTAMSAGQEIEFVAERINGKLTITEIRK